MLSWWFEDPRVPKFITHCEEAQRKVRQAGLAISDAWLVVVISHSLLAEKRFPDKRPKFEGLLRLYRTWETWSSHFQDAQEELERVIRNSNPSKYSFGSANAASNIHGILHNGDTVHPATSRSRAQVPPTRDIPADKFIDYFNGLMHNMASAAANNKAVIE